MADTGMSEAAMVLDGATVVVVHTDTTIGRSIADGLEDHGADVRRVETLMTREEYEQATARACPAPPAAFVVPVSPFTGTRRPLVELGLDEWLSQCETPLRDLRNAVQAAFASLASPSANGGTIVLVAPTAALTGESGLAAYSTAAEGARAMARVVARGWGAHDIRLHWVGAPTELFTDEAAAPRMAMWDAALGRAPDARRDLASAIAALVSPAMRFTTGTTTVVDGGLVMPT